MNKYRLRSEVLHDVPSLYRELFLQMQTHTDVASIKGFLYTLCALFYRELDQTAEDTFAGSLKLLSHIFVFIEKNVDKPCTLHDLSEELRYNESYLSRIFYKHTGISYSDYVRNIKIDRACYLLRNTDENIFSIAQKCGYTAHSSFNRSFKQIKGITPHEYRVESLPKTADER
jgi:AraC-like DNA-binding protein